MNKTICKDTNLSRKKEKKTVPKPQSINQYLLGRKKQVCENFSSTPALKEAGHRQLLSLTVKITCDIKRETFKQKEKKLKQANNKHDQFKNKLLKSHIISTRNAKGKKGKKERP